ncbi:MULTISPECIES: hypothetical protein [unclassified Thermosipho (in: thermotogales)]|uniref:hypothetical protein n=1 Tax=unclassified Thermosipho (in: thermotogales) TaxID=2676525 RepID=UPI000986673D|nr:MULTISPECIES: hypothetical protein [unclassified Thermosipho (in: thermotogales)]MBT1248745.1 hypothetical protein [Thermosipho sp. 1244]
MKKIFIILTILCLILSMSILTLYGKGIVKYTWILRIPGRIPGGQSIPSFEKLYTRFFTSFILNLIAVIFLISLIFKDINFRFFISIYILSLILIGASLITTYNFFQLLSLLLIIPIIFFSKY